jgi:hypothetical protein
MTYYDGFTEFENPTKIPTSKRIIDDETSDILWRASHIPLWGIRGVNLAGEFSQTTKTDDYTAANEMVILVNAVGGKVIITLPAAASNPGKLYYIKKIDTTNNPVVVKGNAVAETIDGEKEFEIRVPYTCITPLCDGTDWWII